MRVTPGSQRLWKSLGWLRSTNGHRYGHRSGRAYARGLLTCPCSRSAGLGTNSSLQPRTRMSSLSTTTWFLAASRRPRSLMAPPSTGFSHCAFSIATAHKDIADYTVPLLGEGKGADISKLLATASANEHRQHAWHTNAWLTSQEEHAR